MDRAVSSLLGLHGFILRDFEFVEFNWFEKHSEGSLGILRACGFRVLGFKCPGLALTLSGASGLQCLVPRASWL